MKLIRLANDQDGLQWLFECPGCHMGHSFRVSPSAVNPNAPVWAWNGDVDEPTFSPSLLCRIGDGRVCHSFVRNGRIEFLADCSHELRGQTVDIPDLDF